MLFLYSFSEKILFLRKYHDKVKVSYISVLRFWRLSQPFKAKDFLKKENSLDNGEQMFYYQITRTNVLIEKEIKSMEKDEKLKALDAALVQIEKQYGKGAVMKLGDPATQMHVETIPTGSLSLDLALGLEIGRAHV